MRYRVGDVVDVVSFDIQQIGDADGLDAPDRDFPRAIHRFCNCHADTLVKAFAFSCRPWCGGDVGAAPTDRASAANDAFSPRRNSPLILKWGTNFASTITCAPVPGLREMRARRGRRTKLPKPRISTRPPLATCSVIAVKSRLTVKRTSSSVSPVARAEICVISADRVSVLRATALVSEPAICSPVAVGDGLLATRLVEPPVKVMAETEHPCWLIRDTPQ